MISFQWCREVPADDRDEVRALLAAAADYDAEAGFSAINAEAVDTAAETTWHLLVRARRGFSLEEDAPLEVIAYLHLSVDADGQGTAQYTVHPDYRSRGVTTMLVEELGLDVAAEGGWAGTGATALRAWAFGSHPAAERLTDRFDIPATGRLWTLAKHLTGPFSLPLAPAPAPDGAVITAPTAVSAAPRGQVDAVLEGSGLPAHLATQLADELDHGHGSLITAVDAAGAPTGLVWFDPAIVDHDGLRASWLRALVVPAALRKTGVARALLTTALEQMQANGTQVALIRIDPRDEGAVRMLRLMAFEQEEAHACFQLGEWDEEATFQVR